jgi:hypothetical protein
MEHAIVAKPYAQRWTVKSAAFDNPRPIQSGENAEVATCDLGTKMARVSVAVVVEIFLRDGSPAERYVCAAHSWRAL